MSSPATRYRSEIDGLRAMAVLSVVLYHAFPLHLPGGFIGVDVFFVISGFLISDILFNDLLHQRFSLKYFYSKRIPRIFPALILVLVSSLAFAYLALLPDELAKLSKHTFAGTTFVSNFVLMHESGYFDTSADTKPLLHLWSLSIEEQFYIFWPLILYLFWRFQTKLSLYLALTTIIALCFVHNIQHIQDDIAVTFYSPLARAWELASGGLLAYAFFKRRQSNLRIEHKLTANLFAILGLALLCFGFFYVHDTYMFPGFWAVIPVIGTLMIISAGNKAWLNRIVLSHTIVRWFGLISYPLYLWHWPIISFLWIIESGKPSASFRVAGIIVAILLAWLTYQFIERPFRQNRIKGATYILITLMVLTGLTASFIYLRNGLPNRSVLANITEVNLAPTMLNFDDPVTHAQCLKVYQLSKKVRFCNNSLRHQKATIALIGDSHAKAMYEAISQKQKP